MTKIAASSHSRSGLSGFASVWRKGALAVAIAMLITGLLPPSASAAVLDHLILSPATSTVAWDDGQVYTAEGYDAADADLGNVTTGTTFTIDGGGSCTGARCSSDTPGDYTVTGTDGTATGTATLHVTSAAAGDWNSWHNGPANTGFNPYESTISAANISQLDIAWSGNSGVMYGKGGPVVANSKVYVAGWDGVLRVYAAGCGTGADTCTPLWTADIQTNTSDQPTIVNGVVYVGNWNQKMFAFDAAGVTGCSGSEPNRVCTPLWTANLDGRVESSPAVTGGVVYFTTSSGWLYAFAVGCNSGGGTCSPLWKGAGSHGTTSSPAVAGGVVYVGGYDGNLYAYSVGCASGGATCSPLWSGATGATTIGSSPVVANGEVYIGASDGYLYTFNVGCASGGGTCTPAWKASVGGETMWVGSPATDDGVVYVPSTDGLYAFAAACGSGGSTCTPTWTAAIQNATTPSVANGLVYVGSRVGVPSAAKLFALAVGCASGGGTCTPVWSHLVPGGTETAITVSNGAVYVGTGDNNVYAFKLNAGLAHGDWRSWHSDPANTGFNPDETTISKGNVSNLDIAWSANTGQIDSSSAPVVANGVVYVAAWDGVLHAYAAGCGAGGSPCTSPLWTADLGSSVSNQPTVVDGVVYVGTWDSQMLAFDAAGVIGCSGSPKVCTPLWRASLDNRIESAPAVTGGVVYISTFGGWLYAIAVGCNSGGGTCTPLWRGAVSIFTSSSPAVAGGVVYVGGNDGNLYAFSVGCASGGATCSPLWVGATGADHIGFAPVVANGEVYIGASDGYLYSFNIGCASGGGTCTPAWKAYVGGQGVWVGSPATANGVVYVSGTYSLYAFAAACGSGGSTCSPMWTADIIVGTPPAIANGIVYVTSRAGDLSREKLFAFAVGCASGGGTCTPLWSQLVPGLVGSAPSVSHGAVYLVSGEGNLYAYELNAGFSIVVGPASAAVYVGGSRAYTAERFGGGISLGDVTADTNFTISDGSCTGATCTANSAGDLTVTGTYGSETATATLHATSNEWSQFQNGPTHQGNNTSESVLTPANVQYLSEAWKYTAGDMVGPPVVAGGVAYVGSNDHKLYALPVGCAKDGGTCTPLWYGDLGSEIYGAPAVANGVVYVTSGHALQAFAVGCASGDAPCAPLWTAPMDGSDYSPTVSAGVVYVSDRASLKAFAVGCASGGGTCTPIWTAPSGVHSFGASPTVAGGVVYVGSEDDYVYAYAVGCNSGGGTCTPIWKAETGNSVQTSAAVSGGVVYISSQDYKLYAFAVGCGTGGSTCLPLWTGLMGYGSVSTPAVADGVVYSASLDGKLYAFAVGCASGGGACTPLWTGNTTLPIRSSPAVANGVVYVGNDSRLLAYAVGCGQDGGTCAPLFQTSLPDSLYVTAPAISNGVVYFGSSYGGTLHAFDLNGLDHITISPTTSTVTTDGGQTYVVEGFSALGVDLGDYASSATFTTDAPASCTGVTCSSTLPGDYPVTATIGSLSTQATLHVTAGTLHHLVVSPHDVTVLDGGSQTYTAEGFDAHGNDLGDFTSSTIFTIDTETACPAQTCTASGPGDHAVTGTDGDAKGTAMLRVNGPMTHLRVSPASSTVLPGGTKAYTANGLDAFNHDLGDVTADTSFTIDSGTACPSHVCTAAALGSHTVRGADGTATGTATLRAALSTGWSQFHGGPTHEGNNATETRISPKNVANLQVAWTSPGSGAIAASPVVSDGVVYVGSMDSSDHSLYAFAAGCESGGGICSPLWVGAVGGEIYSTPAVADGVVYVSSGNGWVYAFAVGCNSGGRTCDPIWKGHAGRLIFSSPAVADGVVYVGSDNGDLYAFAVGCGSAGEICDPLWTGPTGGMIDSSPAVADGVVYVGSQDHKLYAFQVGCGTGGLVCDPLWTGLTGDQVESSPAVANGVVYVGSDDHNLYAFQVGCNTGGNPCTPLWKGPTGDFIYSSPAVADGVVYVGSMDGSLYAFAVGCGAADSTCTPLWVGATGAAIYLSAPAVANGVVYIGPSNGTLVAYAVGCGSNGDSCDPLLSASVAPMNIYSSPAIFDGVVYMGSMGGSLIAYGLDVGPLDHIVINPATSTIAAGGSQAYTAEGFDADGHSLGDVTADTTFIIDTATACPEHACSSTTVGDHTVTGTDGSATATATLTVGAADLAKLVLSGPATATVGTPGVYTVTAEDTYDNPILDYSGSVTVTSGDSAMTTSVATAFANGVGTFNVTFNTKGSQTLAAHDATFTSNDIAVAVDGPMVATKLVVTGPATATLGGAQTYTVTAEDDTDATVTDYPGTVTIVSSDGAFASSPASHTLTNGVGTFSVTFNTAASQTVGAHDGGSLTSNDLVVTVGAFGAAAHLIVAGPATATAGVAQDITVTAKDALGNTVTDYAGDVTITSSDGALVSAPTHGTLTSGVGTFSVTLKTAGSQTVGAGDGTPSHAATPVSVAVGHGELNKLVLTGPSAVVRGIASDYTVSATDTFGNPVTDYAGTVTMTSSDSDFASSPPSSTLTSGVGTFHVSFRAVGSQTLGAGDGTLTATNLAVTVRVDGTNTYHSITPVRLLDTRVHNGATGKLRAGVPVTIQITTRGGIPADASAITGNVTVVNQTSAGSVYVGPDPLARPTTWTVTFSKTEVTPVGITMGLSATGALSATYMPSSGTTDLVLDVSGYFTPGLHGDTYHPVTPARVLDTRVGNGLSGKLKANTPRTFIVGGRGGVPTDATAVTGNLTVTGANNGWAVYLGPNSVSKPTSSTINFTKGRTVANNLTSALSPSGTLSATFISSGQSTTDLVFDVTGYYTADATGLVFVPLTPASVVDTRSGLGLSGRLAGSTPRTLTVTGHGGVAAGALAIAGLITATNQTSGCAIYAGPAPIAHPATSSLNFVRGDTRTNGLTVALSSSGNLSLTFIASGPNKTNVIVSVTGYFVPIPFG